MRTTVFQQERSYYPSFNGHVTPDIPIVRVAYANTRQRFLIMLQKARCDHGEDNWVLEQQRGEILSERRAYSIYHPAAFCS